MCPHAGILDSRENLDGFNFDVSRTITANFDMTHAIHFGSQTEPPSYNFMTRYFSPSGVLLHSLPVLAGLIDLWLAHVPKV